ncbi:MAG: DUF4199 domain-containing protein [Saprospiraceae bacterium]
MNTSFVKFGSYYAILNILMTLVIYLLQPELLFNMYFGWIWLVVLIVFMVLATSEKKKRNDGFITLQNGFKESWLTLVIGMGISILFNYVLMNFIDAELLTMQKEAQIQAVESIAKSWNLPEENVQKQIEEINSQEGVGFGKTIMSYAVFLVVGAIPAIIIAAVMKKSEDQNV